jgi:hypothetical protein
MTTVTAEQQSSARRAAPQTVQAASSNGRPPRGRTPVEADTKKRVQAVRRAATRIKTTARIDTITLGRD